MRYNAQRNLFNQQDRSYCIFQKNNTDSHKIIIIVSNQQFRTKLSLKIHKIIELFQS